MLVVDWLRIATVEAIHLHQVLAIQNAGGGLRQCGSHLRRQIDQFRWIGHV